MPSTTTTGLTALRFTLKTAGISQADLARELGCTRQWVHDVLLGRVYPSPRFGRNTSILSAEALDADPVDLEPFSFPEPNSSEPNVTPSAIGQGAAQAVTS
jgi:transcriptional regulator with XRE-family HTH domain